MGRETIITRLESEQKRWQQNQNTNTWCFENDKFGFGISGINQLDYFLMNFILSNLQVKPTKLDRTTSIFLAAGDINDIGELLFLLNRIILFSKSSNAVRCCSWIFVQLTQNRAGAFICACAIGISSIPFMAPIISSILFRIENV